MLNSWLSSIRDRITDQSWFLQLRSRWDELDAKTRNSVSYGAMGILVLGILYGTWSAYDLVSSLKTELQEKTELLTYLEGASEETRLLKEKAAGRGGGRTGESWKSYFESKANISKIGPGSVQVSDSVSAQSKSDATPYDEELIEISVNKINIRQLLRFAQQIEFGERPLKLRHITIGAQSDLSGYLDAKLSVSAFTMK